MNTAELLTDAFGRICDAVDQAAGGLTATQLAARLDRRANSIGWLIWHLTRIQDDHVAEVAGLDQVWQSQGWADRFALPFDPAETGYSHSSEEVAAVQPASADLLIGYHRAVHDQTVGYLAGLSDDDLDRIVDHRWDPPVTLGVRLVSVICDDLEHVGQAAFIRGVLERS